MTRPAAQDLAFTRVAGTCLYQTAASPTLVFLRWSTVSPPASLTLEDAWANSGPPGTLGYLVFLSVWSASSASALETGLRAALSQPLGPGFVWATLATGGNTPVVTVQTLLATKQNSGNLPCVDGDTRLAGPPGSLVIGFSDGSPVTAIIVGGYITSFVITNPPMGSTGTPSGLGANLPMNGDGIGCIRFLGLVNAFANTASSDALKATVSVSVDPLHPVDPSRNYQTFTGQQYGLTFDGQSYHLSPAS